MVREATERFLACIGATWFARALEWAEPLLAACGAHAF